MDKLYVCKCGKTYTNPQSYNAHLSHCKVNLGEERYNRRLEQQRHGFIRANEVKSEICKEEREERYRFKKIEWESSKHYCERCGKELPHNYEDIYGQGRFCSITCANTRDLTEETKIKISLNSEIKGKANRSLNGRYKGYYCASSYELIFLIYCLDHNIKIERNKFTFKYSYDNIEHVYIPDWYLPDTDTIIECKGRCKYFNEDIVNIKAKSVYGHNYKLLYGEDLDEYWRYCRNKYNVRSYKKFCELMYETPPVV